MPVVPLNDPLRYAHLPPTTAVDLRCPALYVELVRRPLPAEVALRFSSLVPLGTLARRDRGHTIADYKIVLLAQPLTPLAGRKAAAPQRD